MPAVARPRGRVLVVVVALLAVALTGCRRPAAGPTPVTPVTPTTSEPASARVGIVDLEQVARAHPRWPELAALTDRVARAEADLAMLPPPPPVPQTDLEKALTEEAARLHASFEEEMAALREQRRREMEAYAEELRKANQETFTAIRQRLEQEAEAAIVVKAGELKVQLRAAEAEIMEEYRYPLLNLRLRAEVAGLRSEEEGRQVLRQLQALQQEREERIRAKNEEMQKTFLEFQKAKEAEVNARLKAEEEALNAESQQRLAARQREVEEELKRVAAERERGFKERIERRKAELLRTAEAQLRGQQGAFLRDLDARAKQLRAELLALQEQRARLEDSILAEVKIEVATIAQAQHLDVILTRLVAAPAGVDITQDVIRKLRR